MKDIMCMLFCINSIGYDVCVCGQASWHGPVRDASQVEHQARMTKYLHERW